jgi:hypothetical protein
MAEPHLTVRNLKTDEDMELFMSFGHLNEITKLFNGNPSALLMFDMDPALVEPIFVILTAKRNPAGKVSEITPFDFDITEAEKIMDWCKDHLIGFFARRLTSSRQSMETNQNLLRELGLSSTGTASEPLTKP